MGQILWNALIPQMKPGLYEPQDSRKYIPVDEGLPSIEELDPPGHLLHVGGLWTHVDDLGEKRIYKLALQDNSQLQVSEVKVSNIRKARLLGLLELRDKLRALLEGEWSYEKTDAELADMRGDLNNTLSWFLEGVLPEFEGRGRLLPPGLHRQLMRDEPDAHLVFNLYKDVHGVTEASGERATILQQRVYYETAIPERPGDPEEAAILSWAELGAVGCGLLCRAAGSAQKRKWCPIGWVPTWPLSIRKIPKMSFGTRITCRATCVPSWTRPGSMPRSMRSTSRMSRPWKRCCLPRSRRRTSMSIWGRPGCLFATSRLSSTN